MATSIRAAENTASSRNRKPGATVVSTPPAKPRLPRNPAIRPPAKTSVTASASPAAASVAGSRRTSCASVTGDSGAGGCSRSHGGTAFVTTPSTPNDHATHPQQEQHTNGHPGPHPGPRSRLALLCLVGLERGLDLVGQQQVTGHLEVALGHVDAHITPRVHAVDRPLKFRRNPIGAQPRGQHPSMEGGGNDPQQHHLAPSHALNGSLARRGAKRPG